MQKKFDNWNELKQNIEKDDITINIKEKNIYFLSIGQNIGIESYGKGDKFLRPVIVYRKLGSKYFLGIPLTSKVKDGSYYFTFNRPNGKQNSAMLNQMRTFDARRVVSYDGKISNNIYKNLQIKMDEFLSITSTINDEGVPTRAKDNNIIPQKDNNIKSIPFHKTHTTQEEIDSAIEAIKSGWLTMGPKTVEFEERFKEYIGSKEAISLNSATASLHLALKAIGLKRGDEVILPTNTFVATAEVVTYFDATPILCDIEEDTHNIDISKIEPLITNKTKAIIPVHFAGQPCDMDEIYEIAKKYNLKVIEDSAHAIPSSYKGVRIGNLSGTDITCFSFYATKTLSTGEGGMATTNSSDYAKTIKINRLHGISKDAWDRYTTKGAWHYDIVDNGNKYNTTDINSAIGMVQLKKQDTLRDKREAIAKRYIEAFRDNSKIILPYIKSDRETSWHLFVIKIDNRDKIIEELKSRGVGCSVHFIPVHKHTYYKNRYEYKDEDYPVANRVFEKSLSLPIYPDMSDDEIDFVIRNILELVNNV